MSNPLLMLAARAMRRQRTLRRSAVRMPSEVPGTDAVFLVLRRMRAPLIVLILIFAVSVAGLAMMPGRDASGNPHHMSVFDAFYFMSYTATTIGFGELPHTFTYAQRLWVTLAIYASVVGWAYAIGVLFALLQDHGFREAISTQRFRRAVERLREPFFIIAGYGDAGGTLVRALDELGRRVVVVDRDRARVDRLATDDLLSDVPGLEADVTNPSVLGLAGMGRARCAGVLAMTGDDQSNLAVSMSVNLLRPEVPVIARARARAVADAMADFSPTAIINPYDRFGSYLTLALQHPTTYQLVSWLMSDHGTPLPPFREGLADGPWVVLADDHFGEEVAADLADAGLDVSRADPNTANPELRGVVGLIAGSKSDTTNLALVAHARLTHPDVFLVVRQERHTTAPLLDAFDPDSVFMPSALVVRETLARIATPTYWSFIEHVLTLSEDDARALRERLVAVVGERAPRNEAVTLDATDAPAVARWLGQRPMTVGDLLRDPERREEQLALVPLALVRKHHVGFVPEDDEPLELGDTLVLGGRSRAFTRLSSTLYYDATVEYVTTGDSVPQTWLWRALTRRRRERAS